MSVETLDQPAATPQSPVSRPRDEFREPELNEFQYAPVPVLAVAGLVLSLLSFLGLFVWMVLPLCAVAVLLSGLALLKISRSNGAYSGRKIAVAGLVIGLAFLLGGVGFQVYAYQNELPEGYQRVSFLNDISVRQLVQQNNRVAAPPEVAALDGKQVFIKGYMYQSRETGPVNRFMFVKDNQDCCFGADVKIWDQLWVTLKDDNRVPILTNKVAIAGTFRVNPDWQYGNDQVPLYLLEGERFITQVSDF